MSRKRFNFFAKPVFPLRANLIIALIVFFAFGITGTAKAAATIENSAESPLIGIPMQEDSQAQVPPIGDSTGNLPSSPDWLVLADKEHDIGNYTPDDLVELTDFGAAGKFIRLPAFGYLRSMMQAMDESGYPASIVSAYRSYETQGALFANYKRASGDQAYRFSAQAGHSEHQLGLAVDFGAGGSQKNLTARFVETKQGQWLEEHAWEFGFVESYPKNAESITGYIYEPWHYRFIGPEAAKFWRLSGLTLNQFLAQPNPGNQNAAVLPDSTEKNRVSLVPASDLSICLPWMGEETLYVCKGKDTGMFLTKTPHESLKYDGYTASIRQPNILGLSILFKTQRVSMTFQPQQFSDSPTSQSFNRIFRFTQAYSFLLDSLQSVYRI